jgi:GNAT superfamily N-acetyltransferase
VVVQDVTHPGEGLHVHRLRQRLGRRQLIAGFEVSINCRIWVSTEANADTYEYEIRDGLVAACVERKRVQWYQWEIRHLSVGKQFEGKGLAFAVYGRAEAAATEGGACVLQCTIREGNRDSETFFRRQGFRNVGGFYYERTANNVGIWQKALRTPPEVLAPGGS